MELEEIQNLYDLVRNQQHEMGKLDEKVTKLSLELWDLKCELKDKGVLK